MDKSMLEFFSSQWWCSICLNYLNHVGKGFFWTFSLVSGDDDWMNVNCELENWKNPIWNCLNWKLITFMKEFSNFIKFYLWPINKNVECFCFIFLLCENFTVCYVQVKFNAKMWKFKLEIYRVGLNVLG
jgi:hypothetical protein